MTDQPEYITPGPKKERVKREKGEEGEGKGGRKKMKKNGRIGVDKRQNDK